MGLLSFKPIIPEDISRYAMVKKDALMPTTKTDFVYSAKFKGVFIKRGIKESTLVSGMIYERKMWTQGIPEGMKIEVICCPMFKGKALVNVRFLPLEFLDYEERFYSNKDGAEMYFVGAQNIKGFYEGKEIDSVILVHREIDRLSLLQVGFENVLTIPEVGDLNWINESILEVFSRVKIVYLAFCSTSEGITLKDELSRRIGKEKCKTINLPSDCEGPNDIINDEGPYRGSKETERGEKLKHALATSKPMQLSGIYVVSDFSSEINELYKNGYPEGFKTGKNSVDKGMTIFPGCFSVVTGVPGTGKSTLLKCLYPKYHEWAANNGKYLKMGMYSAEDKSETMAFAKLLQNKTGKFIVPHENQMSEMELSSAKAWLNENFILIRPSTLEEWLKERNISNANTLEGILMYAEVCVILYGMNWLVIDNWATVEKDYKKGESQDVFTGRALYSIVEWASKFNCHVTLVAHPTKTEVDAHGNFKRIGLYNISGSSHFYNMPDLGIALQRDRYRQPNQEDQEDYYKKTGKLMPKGGIWIRDFSLPTEVQIDKVREEWMGNLGHFNAYMDKYRGNSFVFKKDELHKKNKREDYSDKIKEKSEEQISMDLEQEEEELPF